MQAPVLEKMSSYDTGIVNFNTIGYSTIQINFVPFRHINSVITIKPFIEKRCVIIFPQHSPLMCATFKRSTARLTFIYITKETRPQAPLASKLLFLFSSGMNTSEIQITIPTYSCKRQFKQPSSSRYFFKSGFTLRTIHLIFSAHVL